MKPSISTMLRIVGLVLLACVCYGFVIATGCASSVDSFPGDVRAFHGSGC